MPKNIIQKNKHNFKDDMTLCLVNIEFVYEFQTIFYCSKNCQKNG